MGRTTCSPFVHKGIGGGPATTNNNKDQQVWLWSFWLNGTCREQPSRVLNFFVQAMALAYSTIQCFSKMIFNNGWWQIVTIVCDIESHKDDNPEPWWVLYPIRTLHKTTMLRNHILWATLELLPFWTTSTTTFAEHTSESQQPMESCLKTEMLVCTI